MIIIFSRTDDGSSTFVAEWLTYFKKDYIIISSDDERTKLIKIDIGKQELIISQDGVMLNLLETSTSVWNRRRGLSIKSINVQKTMHGKLFFDTEQYQSTHRDDELKYLVDYIHSVVTSNSIKSIGNFECNDVNKMKVLSLAKDVGLNVPESFIFTKRTDLIDLINNRAGENIITKALGQGVYRHAEQYMYYSYVERISSKNIKSLPSSFFPSLFQIEIEKKYELRIFYLEKQFYSMAIFSQKNNNTKVDFRKPNIGKPDNRKVPYKLPIDIETKLVRLMEQLGLNSGSIDIIVDNAGNYIFLEVNPVGQFSMTSYPCNYYLEKKIAEYL